MEMGNADEIYKNPAHPYTKALFSAIPPTSPFEEKEAIELTGEIPSPLNMPPGCPFGNRCPYCTEECKKAIPELKEMGNGHKSRLYSISARRNRVNGNMVRKIVLAPVLKSKFLILLILLQYLFK